MFFFYQSKWRRKSRNTSPEKPPDQENALAFSLVICFMIYPSILIDERFVFERTHINTSNGNLCDDKDEKEVDLFQRRKTRI